HHRSHPAVVAAAGAGVPQNPDPIYLKYVSDALSTSRSAFESGL
ncbi:hypothetical protein A2U01_0075267, partial [Trifolium medium]|nr:hypothetical protein [Trifolium medium]